MSAVRQNRRRDRSNRPQGSDGNLSDQVFLQYLKRKKFAIVPVKADGNCYFRTIAFFVYGHEDMHLQVRLDLANYMIKNRDAILNELPEISYEADLAEIMEEGEWGGTVITYVVVKCYNLCVDIYQPSADVHDRILPYGNRTQEFPLISVSYHPEFRHFNVLLHSDNNQREILTSKLNHHFTRCISDSKLGNRILYNRERPLQTNPSASGVQFYERDGYANLALVGNSQGNARVEFLVLIPKEIVAGNITEALEQAEILGLTVYYTFSYAKNRRFKDDFLQDATCNERFHIFSHTLEIPWAEILQYRYHWLGDLLLPHLVATAFKVKWRRNQGTEGVTFELLVMATKNSLLNTDIFPRWPDIKPHLSQAIEEIALMKTPVFCFKCTSSCPQQNKNWHIDLSNLHIRIPKFTIHSFVFEQFHLFGSGKSANENTVIWNTFTKIFENSPFILNLARKNAVNELLLELDANAATTDYYCTYLFLIANSEDESIKYLYAGRTKNKPHATYHFENYRSPVYKVLNSTSTMFILRSTPFQNIKDAQLDESIVIEILKRIIKKARQTKQPFPFLLLNCRSESSKLHARLTPEMYTEIQDFVDNGIPVFRNPDQPVVPWNGKYFQGNYVVSERVDIPVGPYSKRNYAACSKYREKVFDRNVNGRNQDDYLDGRYSSKEEHRRLRNRTCPKCKRKFCRREQMLLHCKLGNCGQTACPRCGKKLRNSNLQRHLNICGLTCQHCGRTGFKNYDGYNVHLKSHRNRKR